MTGPSEARDVSRPGLENLASTFLEHCALKYPQGVLNLYGSRKVILVLVGPPVVLFYL